MVKVLTPWRYRKGFSLGTSTSSKSKNLAAQRGINYHKKVFKHLGEHVLGEADGAELLVEPWFQKIDNSTSPPMRSPDAVICYPDTNCALVVEVKLNWADGKDDKLIYEYLPIVQSAFSLDAVWPLLITQCLRGYNASQPLLGLQQMYRAYEWEPGRPTPVLLLP